MASFVWIPGVAYFVFYGVVMFVDLPPYALVAVSLGFAVLVELYRWRIKELVTTMAAYLTSPAE